MSITAAILALIAFNAPASNAQTIKEGQWSFTMVTQMEGEHAEKMKEAMKDMPPEAMAMMKNMPGMKKMGMSMGMDENGITTTVTQCITNDNPLPEMKETKSDKNCKQSHEVHGKTVKFHASCETKRMKSETEGTMTYSDNAMEGVVKSHQVQDGQAMDMKINVSGKYLGACKG